MDYGLMVMVGTACACCVVMWAYINKANKAIDQSADLEMRNESLADDILELKHQVQSLEYDNEVLSEDCASLTEDLRIQELKNDNLGREVQILEAEAKVLLEGAFYGYDAYNKLLKRHECLMDEYRDFMSVCKIHCPKILDRLIEYRRHV
jgi:regulator of replication initiation timing